MKARVLLPVGIAVIVLFGATNIGKAQVTSNVDGSERDTSEWITYMPYVGFVQEVLDPVTYRIALYSETTYAKELVCPQSSEDPPVFHSYLEPKGVRIVRLVGLEKNSSDDGVETATAQLNAILKGERLEVFLGDGVGKRLESSTTWALIYIGRRDRDKLLNVLVLGKGWACPNRGERKHVSDSVWNQMTAASSKSCSPD